VTHDPKLLGDATVTTVVIKRGASGASVFSAAERIDVPGSPVEAVNTVGAGDSFAAGLVVSRLSGADWYQSCRFGNACGAIVVTRHGCAMAFPTRDEVEDFVAASGGF